MIRPLSLRIREFRGWRESEPLPMERALTLVVGANGRGKSSTLDAVEWCFYGREVEKEGQGLQERADWEVRPREARGAPTEVEVVLEVVGEGACAVTRRREAGAARRAPDDLTVALPDGRRLAGEAAATWVRERLPDLEGFRRAHALHPEAVRRRATHQGDRSAVLAALLGLDEDRALRRLLDDAGRLDLVKQVDLRLRTFEQGLLAAAARPAQDRDDAERRLAAHGLGRGELGPATALGVRRRVTERARRLAERLGLTTAIPDPTDERAVLAWAPGWPALARGPSPALVGLGAKRAARGALAAGLAALEPNDLEIARLRAEYLEAVRQGGDRPARAKAREEAEARWREAQHRRKASDGVTALLADARRALDASPGAPCPVCGTDVPGLPARLDEEIARRQGPDAVRLAAEDAAAHAALERCRRAEEALSALEARGKAAREELARARGALAPFLPAGSLVEGADPAALAHRRVAALDEEIAGLEGVAHERDQSLLEHGRDVEILRDLEAWTRALARLERDVDVGGLPSSARLSAAIDDVAAFVADVEALGALARAAQAERSRRRLQEANEALVGYYADVVGEDGRRGIHVVEHETPKGLEYRVLDGAGAPAIPVLHQAAINALSIALLCAQAQARARAGGLAWVLLDDPVQSLDERRQQGLARALERLAASCAVLVACTDGPFVAHVRTHVACPRRLLHLGARDGARGTRVQEVEVP